MNILIFIFTQVTLSLLLQDFTICESIQSMDNPEPIYEEYEQNWFERNAILITNVLVVISVGCAIVGVVLIEIIDKK